MTSYCKFAVGVGLFKDRPMMFFGKSACFYPMNNIFYGEACIDTEENAKPTDHIFKREEYHRLLS